MSLEPFLTCKLAPFFKFPFLPLFIYLTYRRFDSFVANLEGLKILSATLAVVVVKDNTNDKLYVGNVYLDTKKLRLYTTGGFFDGYGNNINDAICTSALSCLYVATIKAFNGTPYTYSLQVGALLTTDSSSTTNCLSFAQSYSINLLNEYLWTYSDIAFTTTISTPSYYY